MTLSFWLRDYIYFPLSRTLLKRNRSRTKLGNQVLPPMVTMVASGLWHGGSWNLLLWGGLMGAYQVAERMFTLGRPVLPAAQTGGWRRLRARLLMLVSALFAAALFTMDVPTALTAWQRLADLPGWLRLTNPGLRVSVVLLPAFWLDWMQHRGDDELVFLNWPQPAQAALLALAMLAITLFGVGQVGEPFIYQGF